MSIQQMIFNKINAMTLGGDMSKDKGRYSTKILIGRSQLRSDVDIPKSVRKQFGQDTENIQAPLWTIDYKLLDDQMLVEFYTIFVRRYTVQR